LTEALNIKYITSHSDVVTSWLTQKSLFQSRESKDIFPFPKASGPALRPT